MEQPRNASDEDQETGSENQAAFDFDRGGRGPSHAAHGGVNEQHVPPEDEPYHSQPIVDQEGRLRDPRFPDHGDFAFRPGSVAETFVQPETEQLIARNFLYAAPNYPALTGIWLSLLGFITGGWGIVLASLGLVFSATGIWSAAHGAKRLVIAIGGAAIAVVYLIGHAVTGV